MRARHEPAAKSRLALTAVCAVLALVAFPAAAQAHGPINPGVSGFGVAELVVTVAFLAWVLRRVVEGRAGFMTTFGLVLTALRLGERPEGDAQPDEDLDAVADLG